MTVLTVKPPPHNATPQDVEFLKRYIHYCRSQCSPRVNEDAAKRLAAFYVEIRNEVGG